MKSENVIEVISRMLENVNYSKIILATSSIIDK